MSPPTTPAPHHKHDMGKRHGQIALGTFRNSTKHLTLPQRYYIWCPTVQIIWIARRCLIYAESKLSAPNRPCSFSLIILPSRLQNFCMFFELSPKCDDNSHEQNTKTKTATCSKMRASHSRLIFVSDSPAVCLTRRAGSFTRWHNSGCRGCCPPRPLSYN